MSELDEMLVGLRESTACPTKVEAGVVLSQAGWSIFPLPDLAKHDEGLSYKHATRDPRRWSEMCSWQMQRSECHDVNIALWPGGCMIPLVVIDLDGRDAIQAFFDEAMSHGYIDVPLWLRVNTTRPDHGRHIYFASPNGDKYSNSKHRWGGEVRSGRGHVVMPPSTTGHGRYTWVGEKLYSAPDWVVAGMSSARAVSRGPGRADQEIGEALDMLSKCTETGYGKAALEGLVEELRDARPGDARTGRNATLARVVYRALDLALSGELPANHAIGVIAHEYEQLFVGEYGRNPMGELVRCVRSWMGMHEQLDKEMVTDERALEWAGGKRGQATGSHDFISDAIVREGTSQRIGGRRRHVHDFTMMGRENK